MDSLHPFPPEANGRRDAPHSTFSPPLDHSPNESEDDEIALGDIVALLKRRIRPLVGVGAVTFGLAATYLIALPSYEGKFSLSVKSLDELVNLEVAPGGLPGGLSAGLGGSTDYTSLITVLESEFVLEPIVQRVQQQYPDLDYDYEQFAESVTISQVEQSEILDVSFEARDPEQVQFVVEQLQAAYLAYSTDTQQMALTRRLADLDQQVEVQRGVVAQTQAALAQFQGENQLLDLGSASAAIENRRSSLRFSRQDLQVSRETALANYKALQDQLGLQPPEGLVVANLSESPVYQEVLAQYRDIERQIALESARFQADTPIIQALRDKQSQLLPLLQTEGERILGNSVAATGGVNPQTLGYQGTVGRGLVTQLIAAFNEIQVLAVRDQALAELDQSLATELDDMVKLGSDFREIERNLTLAEEALQRLLAAQQELKLKMEAETDPWLIISGFNLEEPLEREDGLLLNLVLAFVAGAMAGVGAAFLMEQIDRSYRDLDQVSKATHLPILAAVPWQDRLDSAPSSTASSPWATAQPSPQGPSNRSGGQSAFEVAFDTLEANLRLLGSQATCPIVAISSVQPGDGKTTVAVHLAAACARLGRKVLLVDGDVGQPSVGARFGLPPRGSLSPMAPTSDTLTLPEVTALSTYGPLDLLQCPDPSSLTTDLLKHYRSDYDLILVDTPDSLMGADTKRVSQRADGILLVLKLGDTDREEVSHTLQEFRRTSSTPILGIVANGVELTR